MKTKTLRPKQTALAFDSAAKVEARGLTYYAVGGWPDYSQWVDPRSVPLCAHAHGPVDPELQARLIKRCLVPQFFWRACLWVEWRGHPAGSSCIVYGSRTSDRFDLWVEREGA